MEYYWEHPSLHDMHRDLFDACYHNNIQYNDIEAVRLAILGENDILDWHWVVRTSTGFAYIHGGCDYTGWDCQSHAERHDAPTVSECLALVPQDERRIFEEMLVNGETERQALYPSKEQV